MFPVDFNSAWFTLIGRGMSRIGLISRELQSVAMPAVLCHKEPARAKYPHLFLFYLLLAGSLWHKDSGLPGTEKPHYRRPYGIKNSPRQGVDNPAVF